MFIFIIGDRGDGKTLTATRFACECKKGIANYPIKAKHIKRLKVKHVFDDKNPDEKTQKKRWAVNWDFWETKKGYSVFIDESYMQFDSRSYNDIKNKIWSSWSAQSRKFLGNQGKSIHLKTLFKMNQKGFNTYFPKYVNSLSNFFLISQTTRRVDVNVRDLVNVLISCEQINIDGEDYTIGYCWFGDKVTSAFDKHDMGVQPKKFLTKSPIKTTLV